MPSFAVLPLGGQGTFRLRFVLSSAYVQVRAKREQTDFRIGNTSLRLQSPPHSLPVSTLFESDLVVLASVWRACVEEMSMLRRCQSRGIPQIPCKDA
jgi:hypothetical protein